MIDFLEKISRQNFPEIDIVFDSKIISIAFEKTLEDIQYHYPNTTDIELSKSIIFLKSELAVFLYRVGNEVYKLDPNSKSIDILHGLLRLYCSCEIYFSTEIKTGFYIVHGIGSVIGSRVKIGKGFVMYQNCTIGHLSDFESGATIGDNVSMFPGSMIIGEIEIGDESIIGANSVLLNNVSNRSVCVGSPAKVINLNGHLENKKNRLNYIPLIKNENN